MIVGKPEGKRPLEDLGIDGRIILKCVFEKWEGGKGMDQIVQDRDRWQAFVNGVMNP
jgi:hypothetical protein